MQLGKLDVAGWIRVHHQQWQLGRRPEQFVLDAIGMTLGRKLGTVNHTLRGPPSKVDGRQTILGPMHEHVDVGLDGLGVALDGKSAPLRGLSIRLDQVVGLHPSRVLGQIHHANLLKTVVFAQPRRARSIDSSLGHPNHPRHRCGLQPRTSHDGFSEGIRRIVERTSFDELYVAIVNANARLKRPQPIFLLALAPGTRVEVVVDPPGVFERALDVAWVNQEHAVARGLDYVAPRGLFAQACAQIVANGLTQISHQVIELQQPFVLIGKRCVAFDIRAHHGRWLQSRFDISSFRAHACTG